MKKPAKETYGALIDRIGKILEEGRKQVAYAVNYQILSWSHYFELQKQIIA